MLSKGVAYARSKDVEPLVKRLYQQVGVGGWGGGGGEGGSFAEEGVRGVKGGRGGPETFCSTALQ